MKDLIARRIGRRSFLAGLGATAALPILAACQPQVVTEERVQVVEREVPVERVVTQIIREEVERIVTVQVDRPVQVERVVTVEVDRPVEVVRQEIVQVEVVKQVVVEQEKLVEVERVVEVERIVEVDREVVVTATPEPAPKIDPELIRKLEGPEIILDQARYPTSFNESPQLAALVENGQLPPVEERLPVPEDVLVIKPVHSIGKYGGALRRGFTGPFDTPNGMRNAGPDHVLFYDYAMTKLVPNVAKDWEVTDGGQTTIVHLRRGLKWSDGQPFTADDFVFWYEDVYTNPDLIKTPNVNFAIQDQPGTLEKIDDYTIAFRFPSGYFMFPEFLAGYFGIPGMQPDGGGLGRTAYLPAHYLKRFHPNYVDSAELGEMVRDAKLENWVGLFKARAHWPTNPDLPMVSPWKTSNPINTPAWVLERNPYYFGVDSDGNQLPYTDAIVMTLAPNLEVLNLRAISGEYDVQGRHISLAKLPVFLQNQARGNYKMHLDPPGSGGEANVVFNVDFDKDPEIRKWFHNRDFRRALSLGIDRHQLNEVFFIGLGTPGSPIPVATNPYNPGEETYRTLWHNHDPDRANEMLDEIGLDQKDGDGYRLRSDGQGRLQIQISANTAWFLPFPEMAEMIGQHWKQIGIDLAVEAAEPSLINTKMRANEVQIWMTSNYGTDRLMTWPGTAFNFGPEADKWFASAGEQGIAPPEPLQKVLKLWKDARTVPVEEQNRIGKEIWKTLVEEVWAIGTVGLAPVLLGVRVVKNNVGNVPGRIIAGVDSLNPVNSHPSTYYFTD